MLIEIDFQSDEAIYMQLRNQIVLGIATSMLQEGDTLYSVLRQEGFVTIDRRRGAVVALDDNKAQAIVEMQNRLRVLLAKGICKNITRGEVHAMVDECYDAWENEDA